MESPKYSPSDALDAFERQDYELVLKLALAPQWMETLTLKQQSLCFTSADWA